MAPKSAKRSAQAASAAAAQEAKKPKLDPLMVGVVDALRQADGLTEECRSMLTAGVPGCFATPAGERHKHQDTLVSWIGLVLDGVQSKMKEAVEAAEADEAEAGTRKQDLEAKVEGAQALLASESEAVSAKEADLKNASQAAVSAEAELRQRRDEQRRGDAASDATAGERELLQRTLEADVRFLKTEEGYDATQAAEHMKTLSPVAARLILDDSLMAALQPAAIKPPAERGAFDNMVLDELEACIQRKVAELEAQLEASAPAREERAAAVAAAQGVLEQAEAARQAAAAALGSAQAQESEAASGLASAKAELEAFLSKQSQAATAKEEKAAALQNFVGYNMECFRMLCEKAAPAGGA